MRERPVMGTDPALHELIDDAPQPVPIDQALAPAHPTAAPRASFLIRVTRPGWTGQGIPDLVITSRLGDVVAGEGSTHTILALEADAEVLSIEASRQAGMLDTATSVSSVKGAGIHSAAVPYGTRGAGTLVAIIDSGIDVFHHAFLDAAGASRIVGIWDQGDTTGPPPAGFAYGTFSSASDIAAFVAKNAASNGLGARDPGGHGTHVASIAAGRACGGGPAFQGGMAPEAQLLIVNPTLNPIAGQPRSIGYSRSHVDALAFIDQFASYSQLPVVVNISQGMNAGAHDGSSALERAFDNFSNGGRKPGRIIVKSAGNERGNGGHAVLHMATNAVEKLTWTAQPVARAHDVIELWYPPSDDLGFQLEDPTGRFRSAWVDWTNPQDYGRLGTGAQFQITLQRFHVDNGASRLFLQIRPSPPQANQVEQWTLHVRARAVRAGGEVDAWVERAGNRAISFTSHVSDACTLSIPGSADSVITVAATDSHGGAVEPSSSFGPTRDGRQKPDLSAPGVGIHAARSGTTTQAHAMTGTSMAAPHVTGAIALALSAAATAGRSLNARQVRSALCHLAQNHNGTWNAGRGYGFLDAEALVRALC